MEAYCRQFWFMDTQLILFLGSYTVGVLLAMVIIELINKASIEDGDLRMLNPAIAWLSWVMVVFAVYIFFRTAINIMKRK